VGDDRLIYSKMQHTFFFVRFVLFTNSINRTIMNLKQTKTNIR